MPHLLVRSRGHKQEKAGIYRYTGEAKNPGSPLNNIQTSKKGLLYAKY